MLKEILFGSSTFAPSLIAVFHLQIGTAQIVAGILRKSHAFFSGNTKS
jgi:hypothetical protein